MNKNKIAGLFLLPALALASCNSEENSIDDYPLNYEITEVKATENIPVGCILYNTASDLADGGRWDRLEDEYDTATGKVGPNMVPKAGKYRFMGTNEDDMEEYATEIGRMAGEMKTAGVDFIITPAIREIGSLAPKNVNREDTIFLNILSGRNQDLSWKNDGSTKLAIQVHMQNFASSCGGFQSSTSSLETVPDKTYEYKDENGDTQTVTMTTWERFMEFAKSLAKYMNEPTYYRTSDGRPVLYLREPDKFFVQDVKKFYDDFRAAVKSVCGANPYIIANIPSWDVVARYQYMMLEGMPDAISARNMADLRGTFDRYYIWKQLTNENFKYNREYLSTRYPDINFIPSVSSGYSNYVYNTQYQYPNMNPSAEDLRTRCWIAKMNFGHKQKMVIVDSYNDWGHANFIESSDPEVGKGVGDLFLKIIHDEFKVN